ncbi:MAG: TonB-dependent receptor [Candidatus Acidoferrales bacterium]|nr:TonB-dependent receptor [Candidatus Acidoferrales bacterium]
MLLRAAFLAALAIPFLCVLVAGNLYAQVEKATLSGTVMDPSGAVIVDAKIQAKNVNTGVTYSSSTDGQGRYILPEMQVGTYEVSAQKAGFQQMVQTGVVLSVGARPILDFKLSVGRSEQVIEVESEASRVDTETAAVGQLLSPNQMENLPSNGRNFTDLLSLAPGVATVPSSGGGGGQSATVYGEQTNYSVSGSRPVGLAYMLDDTDIRDALDHGAGVSVMGTSLGMEAIQEFSVLTNTYSAEFGGTGAAVNAVTKSGTNSLHGSAYEYLRNSVLDSSNYFDAPGQKPTFKRNQFGGSLGGPIKKDKAFFFVNYEGLRAGTGETSRAIVPTSLPDLFEAGGMTYNGTTWVGKYGPISPLTESIFGLYPLAQSSSQCPNVQGIVFLPGTGLFCSHDLQIGNEDYVLGRADYTLGTNDSLFARYVRESAYQVLPYVYTPVPGYPEIDHERNQYLTIEERHTFSPRMLNEVRFGFVRLFTLTANGGVSGPPLQSAPGLQDMDFSPGQNLSSLGPSPTSPSRPVTNRFSAGDDVVVSIGAHSLRFGATVTRVELNQYWDQYPGGAWIFADLSGDTIPGTPLGGSMYGFPLLCVCGAAPTYSYTTPSGQNFPFNPYRYWRQTWLDPYIQDDWNITKRLTLNLGLRYAWASNPTTVHEPVFVINNLTAPTTTEYDFVTAKHPFTSNPNKWNFDPRIGLAWDPFGDHKTSVRAGFGMFHEPVTARTYALDNTSFLPNAPLFFLFFSPGFPALPSSPSAASSIAWYYAILQNVDTAPYVMQYNLNVQRELGRGTVLTVGYNGSSGNHLFFWADANPPLAYGDATSAQLNAPGANGAPSLAATFAGTGATGQGTRGTVSNPFLGLHVNPNFGAVEAVQPRAHSTYNALQVTVSRQFARGLVGNAGYTWSKCLDDASATISTEQGEWAVVDAYNPSLDRGPCSFSSNQVFTANAIYRLPFQGNRLKDGWQVSPIVSAYSGLPFNVQTMFGGLYQSQTGGATEGERPERVPGCKAMVRSKTEWWNPECFVLPPFGTLGNSGRDSLNNPNFVNSDFALFKDTRLTEKVTMQLRAEFFDILNHPNFVVGNQVYLMGTAGTVPPVIQSGPKVGQPNPFYSQLSNPAAYVPPTATTAGGVLCNPSQVIGAPVVGPCYTPTTGLGVTMPGTNGGQRQIQFAVRFMF